MSNSSRVLLTTPSAPIYHNPEPTDPNDIQVQNRWKGKCLHEFYDTKNDEELVRLVVVWNESTQSANIFVDGVWTKANYTRDALIVPGTTEEIKNKFYEWQKKNGKESLRANTFSIDVEPDPKSGTIDDAKKEINGIFASYLTEMTSSVVSSVAS